MWMSLMCRTFSGDDPGESTGIVTSRTTKALRSISEAYPIPATSVPTDAAAVVFRIDPGVAAAMHGSLLPPAERHRASRRVTRVGVAAVAAADRAPAP